MITVLTGNVSKDVSVFPVSLEANVEAEEAVADFRAKAGVALEGYIHLASSGQAWSHSGRQAHLALPQPTDSSPAQMPVTFQAVVGAWSCGSSSS